MANILMPLSVMEHGKVTSLPIRIRDLPTLFKDIPVEVHTFGEAAATNLVQNEMDDLVETPELMTQLNRDCGLTNLFVDDDHATLDCILNVIPNRNDQQLNELKTLTVLKESRPLSGGARTHRPLVDLSFRNIVEESPNATEMLDDIFVTVMLYRPIGLANLDLLSRGRTLVCTQRLVCLASQKLSELKDAIKCPQDKVWLGDCSDALNDERLHIAAEKLYKSSYFFIENTFYDDTRSADHHRLSEPILEWIKGKPEFDRQGTFSSSSMEGTLLADLTVCPGKVYHYVHQGTCEHIMVFSDVRLIDREACQSPDAFPMLTGRCHVRALRCSACRRLSCRWMASNAGDLLPTDPCPLCDVCLRLLLYDKNGRKIRPDLRVHMYCGDEVVV